MPRHFFMPSALNAIIARELSSPSCRKILSGDGVTTPYLAINPVPGIFAGAVVEVKSAKRSLPELGDVASAAKNLDEYQFLICSLVPSLPDSSESKMELQKYRVAILAAFAALVSLLKEKPGALGEWRRNAAWLVEDTSDAYHETRSHAALHTTRHKYALQYFGVPEDSVIAALRSFYGQQ
jgi:hypothetical protein